MNRIVFIVPALMDGPNMIGDALERFRGKKHFYRTADEILGFVTMHRRKSPVNESKFIGLRIRGDHRPPGMIEDEFPFPHSLFGFPFRGLIAKHLGKADKFSIRIPDRARRTFRPEAGAILSAQPAIVVRAPGLSG